MALGTMLTAPAASAQTPATVTLTKTATTTSAAPGTPFSFFLHYSCSSLTTTCDGVVITDVLPPELSHAAGDVSLTGDRNTVSTNYDPGTGTVTFVQASPMPAGTTGVVEITVQFPPSTTPVGASATNTGTISADNAAPATSNPVTVDAIVTPNILATKGPAGADIVAGVPFTYTVGFQNTGNVNLVNPTLTDPLAPLGLTCADVQISGPGVCDPATDTITWTLSTNPAPPGTNETHSFTVTYPESRVGEELTNTVTASGTPLGTTTPISNAASVTNPIVAPAPAVVVTKISAPSPSVQLGLPLTYQVSIRNSGNTPLDSVSMVDTLPPGATFISCSTSGGGGSCTYDGASTVTWTFTQALAVGGTFTGTMAVRYESPPNTAGDVKTNTVDGSGTAFNGQTVSDTASVDTTLTAPGGPGTVSKTLISNPLFFAVDLPVTYSINVANSGATTWTGVTVTDPLPVSNNSGPASGTPATFVSCAPEPCSYDAGTNTVTWTFTGSVVPGDSVSPAPTVTIIYPYPGFQPYENVTNCATAVATSAAGDIDVPQGCDTRQLLPAIPGANVHKSASPSPNVTVGATSTYSIDYSNTGTSPLTSYTVTDVIPPQVEPVAGNNVTFTDSRGLGPEDILEYHDPATNTFIPVPVSCSGNTCTGSIPSTADQARVIFAGVVEPGFSGTMVLTTHVPATAVARSRVEILNGTTISNCAQVTATELTPEASPQSCTTQTIVEPTPTSTLSKSRTSPSPVPPPSPVNWSITYSVPGDSPVPILNPTVTDCLPVGLDLVDPANPGDPANGSPPAAFTPAPSITRVVGAPPCAADQVAVIWSWAGSVPALSLAPGTSGTFTLNTTVQPGTPPETLTNGVTAVADNNATPTPLATAQVVIAQGASLDSIKLIKGSLDSDYSKYPDIGHTTYGGSADYRMEITNSGNVPMDNITAIDILPFVGDTAVLNTASPRDSEWSPVLTGPVTAPAGVTVLYSDSTNPCRPELNYNPAGCVSGSFSPTPPGGDYSAVRSLEFQYPGTLAPGATIQIDWPMVAPASVIPGQVAWNSFGFTGFRVDNGDQLTPAEPNKVGIEIDPYPLQIQKLVNGQAEPNAPGLHILTGDTVTYTYLVTNPGDLTVGTLNLFDSPAQTITCDVPGVGTVPADQATIAPHSTLTCTADAGPALVGEHADTACVTGQPIVDGTPGTVTDQVCDTANYFGATPSISLTKLVNGQHVPNPATGPFVTPGSTVNFTYLITNTGNVTLDTVTLTDDVLGNIINCTPVALPGSLAPGQSTTCTATGPAVTGQQTNTADVTGQPVDNNGTPFGQEVTAQDTGNYFGAGPSISLIKRVNGEHQPTSPGLSVTVGTPITFTYVITNTGNLTLTSISLVDTVLGTIPSGDCTPALTSPLAPNASITCTVPAGDATVGTHHNVATVTGQGEDNSGTPVGPPVTDTDQGWYTGTQATPAVATAPVPTSGPVGTPISDTATLSGGLNPTGFVTFNLFAPGDTSCSTPVATATVPLSGSPPTATSPSFPTTTIGTYHLVAIYSGDTNNAPAESGCTAEPVVIGQAGPTIATFPSGGGPVGSTIFDTATLSGGFNPTGSVTFELFGPDDPNCSPPAIFTDTVPLTARTVRSSATTSTETTAVGTYRWVATYSGDANNAAISSGCDEEPVVIGQATSAVLTTAPSTGGVVGTGISDVATLTGGFNPTGTVSFSLYGPGDTGCATDLVAGNPAFKNLPLTGSPLSAASPSFATTAAGTYRWVASYSGDVNNAPITTGCDEEQVDLTPDTPTISTTPSPGGPVGTVISDAATVGGGFHPTGSVTFELFGPGDATCAGPPVETFPDVALGGSPPGATSPGFSTTAVGTYRWVAIYSGDGNNVTVSSGCQDEPVTTTKATPTIATTPSPGGTVGTSISDTATVSGGFNPTGNVAFLLFAPGDTTCSGPAAFVRIVPLTGTSATSPPFATTAAGTYHWVAVYLGDINNIVASSGCTAEPVTISQATPTIATTPSPGGPVGTTISDMATLSGAFNPTGTVTFKLYGPDDPDCAAAPVFTSTRPLLGIGALSGSFQTTAVGTYRWIATYNGDANNVGVSSGCQEEPVTTTQATPTIDTTASPGGTIGIALSDLATVSGGFNPTGTVTFKLFGPDDATCTGTPVFTATHTLGSLTLASGSFTPVTAGTYRWVATYNGDANNAPISSGCEDEMVTLSQDTPGVVTIPSAGGAVGTPISDSAVLTRGFDPAGTVSFALYGPGDTGCTTNLVAGNPAFNNLPFAPPKVVSGTFTTTTPGTYQWVATFSGDTNNQPANGTCGDPTEQVVITAGPALPGLPPTGYGGGSGWPPLLGLPLLAGLSGLLPVLLVLRRRRRGPAG